MALSRGSSTALLFVWLLLSIVALVVDLHYSVLPSLPHDARVPLQMHSDVLVMRSELRRVLVRDHKISAENAALVAPCWLSLQFLVDQQLGASKMFVSTLDLPYGRVGQEFAEACEPALHWREHSAMPQQHIVLWIQEDARENVYFNESTNSTDTDWFRTYDAEADPPGLVILRQEGNGVSLGAGFLLALILVSFMLPIIILSVRFYRDRHPSAERELEQRAAEREARHFAPLQDDPSDAADLEQVDSSPRRDRTEESRSQRDVGIELERMGDENEMLDEEIMDKR